MTKRTGRVATRTLIAGHERPMGAEDGDLTAITTATKLLLTPQEAADTLSINRSTLYQLLMRGEIPSLTIGRARRIPLKWLETWIEQQLAA